MKISRLIRPALMLAASLACATVHASADAPQQLIRSLISKTYDQPGRIVQTTPIVVVEDHAVADWTQGERGGRALLRKSKDGQWEIVACGGEGFKEAKTLGLTGMPASTAQRLATELAKAEKPLPVEAVRRFDSFGQVVTMSPAGHPNHSPAHP